MLTVTDSSLLNPDRRFWMELKEFVLSPWVLPWLKLHISLPCLLSHRKQTKITDKHLGAYQHCTELFNLWESNKEHKAFEFPDNVCFGSACSGFVSNTIYTGLCPLVSNPFFFFFYKGPLRYKWQEMFIQRMTLNFSCLLASSLLPVTGITLFIHSQQTCILLFFLW